MSDIHQRAVKAYLSHCQRSGIAPQQPESSESDFETVGGTNYCVLRNASGVLAVYTFDARQDALHWVENWPRELQE